MPSSDRNFIFFLNPNSRDGKTRLLFVKLLKQNVIAKDLVYRIEEASSVVSIKNTLLQSPENSIAVAVGGDGTVNMLAQAVLAEGKNRILGVVPFGTGNAVAHQLGAVNAARAMSVLVKGIPVSIDCVETDHPQAPIALISFSSGFESVLLRYYALHRKRQRVVAGLNALLRTIGPARRGVCIELDGRIVLSQDESFYNAGLYIIKKYAYGIDMNATALLEDGMAECVIHKAGYRYWGDILKSALTHSPTGKSFAGTWRRAIISAPAGLQCDGETISGATVELTVLPKALTFLAEKKNEL